MNGSISCELSKNLFGLLEILPGAFGTDIDSAIGIARPAILACIEEIVGVHVCYLLVTILSLAVEPVLRLHSRGELTCADVVKDREADEEWNGKTLKVNHS